MSNAIAFLEAMGQNAELRHAGRAELYYELITHEVDAEAKGAILRGDGARLGLLLGSSAIASCSLFPGKGDEDESEEEPSRDDDEIRSQIKIRRAASAA